MAIAVVVNYIRVAFIDESAKSDYCPSSASSRRYLEERPQLHAFSLVDLLFSFQYSIVNRESIQDYGSRILSSNSKSIGSSIESSCLQYIFVYAFVCLSMLSMVIFVTYVMSSIYLERLLEVCMNRDSISMKDVGREAYLEYLEMMRSSEKKLTDKSQKSLLESSRSSDDNILLEDIFEEPNDIESPALISPGDQSPRKVRTSLMGHQSISSNDNGVDRDGKPELHDVSRNRRPSIHHLSFSLDDYYHEREMNEHMKEHLDEIINQSPWYRQILYHIYRIWLRLIKCCTKESEDSGGRRSSLSDADLNSIRLDRSLSFNQAETIEGSRSGVAFRSLSVSRRVFVFGSSKLYYRIVELGLLFQCFYISIWATQLMPLARRSEHKYYWIPAFTIPIVLNILLVGMTLHRSVMLKAAMQLNPDIVGAICEECIQEKNVVKDLQSRIRNILSESNTPRRLWQVFVRDRFLQYDVNKDGSLDQLEFREFIGSLDIFMGKRHFDILWEAIDIDLSGSVTWDELFVIVFPEFKHDIKEELKVLEAIQQHFKQYFQANKIPKLKYLSTIQEIFSKYDSNRTNSLSKTELLRLFKDLGIKGISKRMFQLLTLSMDYTGEGNDIQFTEFVRVIFGNELASIVSSNARGSVIRSSINIVATDGDQTRRRSHNRGDLASILPFSGIIHPDAEVDANADPNLPRMNPVAGGYKRISTYEMVEMVKKNKELIANPRASMRARFSRAGDSSQHADRSDISTASSSFTVVKVSDEVKESKGPSPIMLLESPDLALIEADDQESVDLAVNSTSFPESPIIERRRESLVLDDSGPALIALMETMRLESARNRRNSIDI